MATFRENIHYQYGYRYSPLTNDSPFLCEEKESIKTIYPAKYQISRACQLRKPAPTLATGRRSKYMVLSGEEATKRERRRQRNRVAAQKLREKRQSAETELNHSICILEHKRLGLENSLRQLLYRKQQLEQELQNTLPTGTQTDIFMVGEDNKFNFYDDYARHSSSQHIAVTNILASERHSNTSQTIYHDDRY